MNEDGKIVLVDDDGVEIEFDVVLQIDLEDENKSFYVISDPEDEEYYDACYTLTDEDDDVFYFVDDPEELDMIQEVLNTITEEELG